MFTTICVYCGQTFDSTSGDTFMEVCDECVEYPGEDTCVDDPDDVWTDEDSEREYDEYGPELGGDS